MITSDAQGKLLPFWAFNQTLNKMSSNFDFYTLIIIITYVAPAGAGPFLLCQGDKIVSLLKVFLFC